MLQTNLKHVESEAQYNEILQNNENVMICCGRMGPMCVPVYDAMEDLENEYPNVKFYDMEFDIPDAHVIRNLPECRGFMGLPFTVYYKNGKVVTATTSIQNYEQIKEILEREF
jgi:thioredoxin 1